MVPWVSVATYVRDDFRPSGKKCHKRVRLRPVSTRRPYGAIVRNGYRVPDTFGVNATSRSVILRPGQTVADQRMADHVCRVRSGWVLSCLNDSDGQRQVAAFLLAHDVRWVTPAEEAAEITALTGAEVEFLPLSTLQEVAAPDTLTALYAEAQRPLLEQVRLLSGRSGRIKIQRLIGYLTLRAQGGASPGTPLGRVILPLTRPVVADALGMTERHVSRVLKDLEGEGAIRLERGQIHVQPDFAET